MSEWKCYADGPYVVTEYAGNQSRSLCKPTNVGRANERNAEQQAVFEVESKIRKRAKKKDRQFCKMQASKYDPKKFWPGTVQPKLDGVACSAYWKDGELILQTRGGDNLDLPHIREDLMSLLPRDHHVDGEIYAHGVALQTINGLVKKQQPGTENLKFWIYDSSTGFDYSCAGVYSDLRVTPTHYVGCDEALQGLWKDYTSQGYEGLMYRPCPYVYEQCPGSKRSRYLQKVKQRQSAEYVVAGYKYGRGKNSDIPTFILETPTGQTFACNGAGTHEQQRAIDPESCIGKMMTVDFFTLTIAGIPSQPTNGVIRPEGF